MPYFMKLNFKCGDFGAYSWHFSLVKRVENGFGQPGTQRRCAILGNASPYGRYQRNMWAPMIYNVYDLYHDNCLREALKKTVFFEE